MSKEVPETDFDLSHLRTTAIPPIRTHPWAVCIGTGKRIISAHRTEDEARKAALEFGGEAIHRIKKSETSRRARREYLATVIADRPEHIERQRTREKNGFLSATERLGSVEDYPFGVREASGPLLLAVFETRVDAEDYAQDVGGVAVDRRKKREIGFAVMNRRFSKDRCK